MKIIYSVLFATIAIIIISVSIAIALTQNGNGAKGNGNGAGPDEDVEDAPFPLGPEEARARDIDIMSAETGMSKDDVEALLVAKESFKKLVEKVKDDNRFSEAVIPDSPGAPAKLFFKNGVPPQLVKTIEQFEAQYGDVEIIETKFSKKDMENRAKRVENKLKAKGFKTFVMVPFADELTVRAKLPQGATDIMTGKQLASAVLDLLSGVDEDIADVQLDIADVADDEIVGFFHTRGGEQIKGTVGACTVAFSGWLNGEEGVIGAGHCGNMNTYVSSYHGYEYSMSPRVTHLGDNGDIAFYATDPGHALEAKYVAGPSQSDVRSVTGYNVSPSVGERVCAYSRKLSQRSCTTVYRTDVSFCADGYGCGSKLVATTVEFTIPGDSGGPWSWGSTAYGINSGNIYIDGAWRSTYTPIDVALSGLGATLAVA